MPSILGYDTANLTFERMLALKAERNGDKCFIHYLPDGRRFSYREVDLISNRIANGLIAHGIGKGSHVAVIMENCPEQILAFFALGKIGAVFTPINPAARGAFLEYYLTHSQSAAVIAEAHLIDQLREIAGDVPQVTQAFVLDGYENLPSVVAPAASLAEHDFRKLLAYPDHRTGIETRFSDLCSLMYTSGTTGPSKGNMFTQAHALTFGIGNRRAHQITGDDVIYCALPFFHVGAWNTYTCGSLLDDGQIALVRRFSVSRFWDEIRASGSTVSFLTAVTQFLMAAPEAPGDRTHGLKLFISGPMPADCGAFVERFGVKVATSFGLSDYSLTHAFRPDDPPAKYGSCGRPTEGCEARIVDDDDFDLPAGQVGEIVLRNNTPWTTASGYFNNPEATAAAVRNMWYHTGDQGMIDEDGFLWFRDRKKDALRRRGENISASEVEAAVLRHPAVLEAAVYAVRTLAQGGDDEVGLSVVLREGMSLDHVGLAEFCGKVLPYFVVPRFIEFLDSFPRTPNQKVRKAEIRERVQAHLSAAWDREAHGIVFTRHGGARAGAPDGKAGGPG